jgi:transposase
MNHFQTIGIDTAKRIFFLHGENAAGKVVLRQMTRERLILFLANQPRTTIAMEAGAGKSAGTIALEGAPLW